MGIEWKWSSDSKCSSKGASLPLESDTAEVWHLYSETTTFHIIPSVKTDAILRLHTVLGP